MLKVDITISCEPWPKWEIVNCCRIVYSLPDTLRWNPALCDRSHATFFDFFLFILFSTSGTIRRGTQYFSDSLLLTWQGGFSRPRSYIPQLSSTFSVSVRRANVARRHACELFLYFSLKYQFFGASRWRQVVVKSGSSAKQKRKRKKRCYFCIPFHMWKLVYRVCPCRVFYSNASFFGAFKVDSFSNELERQEKSGATNFFEDKSVTGGHSWINMVFATYQVLLGWKTPVSYTHLTLPTKA